MCGVWRNQITGQGINVMENGERAVCLGGVAETRQNYGRLDS